MNKLDLQELKRRLFHFINDSGISKEGKEDLTELALEFINSFYYYI